MLAKTISKCLHTPSPTTGIPDINDLRASVKEWDDNFSVPYPNTHFEETVIAGYHLLFINQLIQHQFRPFY